MHIFYKEKTFNYIGIIFLVVLVFSVTFWGKALAEEANLIDANIDNSEIIKSRISHQSTQTPRDYVLGVNDVLSVFVYDAQEFDQEKIRIQPDGNIVVSPLGPIKAAGKSIRDLHEMLVEKYKFYLKYPQVTIRLDQSRPFVAYIRGAVLNPGSYELNTDTTNQQTVSSMNLDKMQVNRKSPLLSNLLVASGGVHFYADLENVKISNSISGTEFSVNLLDIIDKGDNSQDVYLMAGDVVTVPSLSTPLAVDEEKYKRYVSSTFSPKYVPVKVFGYVSRPGLVQLDSSSSASITLNSAIMSAGGYFKDSAYAPKKVYISRADVSGKLVTKAVNPMNSDIMVMPNDIIYVPEKPRPLIARAFEAITKILTPIDLMARTYNNWALTSDPTRYQVIGK